MRRPERRSTIARPSARRARLHQQRLERTRNRADMIAETAVGIGAMIMVAGAAIAFFLWLLR